MKNYYKILEIPPTASLDEIKKQYKFLMNVWHPDKFTNPDHKAKVTEKVIEFNEAYRILSDPSKREAYDLLLRIDEEGEDNLTHFREETSRPQQESYTQTQTTNDSENRFCESCGMPAPTKYIQFFENKGFLVMRSYKSVKGRLCRFCINYFFWNMTGVTFLLGWWGLISAIVTPFILLNNILRFIFSLNVPSHNYQRIDNPSPFWVFSTIAGLGLSFFFGLSIISNMNSSTSSISNYATYTPSKANYATSTPVKAFHTPTKAVVFQWPTPECINWKSVTSNMAGTNKCVFGDVYDSGFVSSTQFRINFANYKSFYFEINDSSYYDVTDGECVVAKGFIRISPDGDLYMNINDVKLYNCD